MNRQNRIINIFLPVLVIYLLQNGVSLFLAQAMTAYVAYENGPVSMEELVKSLITISQDKSYLMLFSALSGIAGIAIFVPWYFRIFKEDHMDSEGRLEINLRKVSPLYVIPGIVLFSFGCVFVASFMMEVVGKIFPEWLLEYTAIQIRMGIPTAGNHSFNLLTFLYLCIIAPLMEEFAFRGVSLRYAMRTIPGLPAVFLTAVLFAILHGNPFQGVYTFVFGLILAYIYFRTEHIWITVLIHGLFNVISYFAGDAIVSGKGPILDFAIIFTSLMAVYLGGIFIIKAYN